MLYNYESWTINKAEYRRNDAFELWCWRRLLRILWTVRRSDQSILKEINPEGLMLKLKLRHFGHLRWRAGWFIRKDPDSRKDWRWEEKGTTEDEMVGWHQWTQWTWVWASSGRWWWTGKPDVLQSMGLQRTGHDWVTEYPP